MAHLCNPSKEDVVKTINNQTNMIGVDGVIITATQNQMR